MPASRTEAFAENGRRNLTLIFTGDLMQHMPQVFAARQRDGSFDYTSCFSRLNNYFSSADFVIANLETTLGEEPYSGYPRFRSPEALAGAMRRAGVDAKCGREETEDAITLTIRIPKNKTVPTA